MLAMITQTPATTNNRSVCHMESRNNVSEITSIPVCTSSYQHAHAHAHTHACTHAQLTHKSTSTTTEHAGTYV